MKFQLDPRLMITLDIFAPPLKKFSITADSQDYKMEGVSNRVTMFSGCTDTSGRLTLILPRGRFIICGGNLEETEINLESAEGRFELELL